MGLFRKKARDVDLTKLEKIGVLKKSREIALNDLKIDVNKDKVVDLSSNASSESALGFLSNLAGAGEEIKRPNSEGDMQSLKVKIDDLEYKLDRFIERLSKIEDKLDER